MSVGVISIERIYTEPICSLYVEAFLPREQYVLMLSQLGPLYEFRKSLRTPPSIAPKTAHMPSVAQILCGSTEEEWLQVRPPPRTCQSMQFRRLCH